jgi:hypothetical protein
MKVDYNPHFSRGKWSGVHWTRSNMICPRRASVLTPHLSYFYRNLRPNLHDKHLNKLFVRSGMQYKICRDTYHMFYIIGSEDIFMRPPSSQTTEVTEIQKQPKWNSWLESSTTGWCRGLSEHETAEKEEQANRLLGPSGDNDMAIDS